MLSVDIPILVNLLMSGLIGFIVGIGSAWVTHHYHRQRDDIAWRREKAKLQEQSEHEKTMLELQFQQRVKELEQQSAQEQRLRIKEELLKGIENPDKAIEELQRARQRIAASPIGVIPIFQDLSAGPGIWIQPEDSISGYLEVNRILINNESFSIINLESPGSPLVVSYDYQYGASPVKGNSMNRMGIEDGDYVIFRRPRGFAFTPHNGDVVVAVIHNGERDGVIKRFYLAANRIILESFSNDPRWATQSYEPSEVDFIGKAIAILKKV